MLTRIVCPNCHHVGATAASLPRVLTCSQCGHLALIRTGKPARSHVAWEEDAARAVRSLPLAPGDAGPHFDW
jgi:hypothetical protein